MYLYNRSLQVVFLLSSLINLLLGRITLFRELALQKGDIVYIHRQVDANWFEGEHHGRAGIFPTTYVEVNLIQRCFSAVLCCAVVLHIYFFSPSQILPPTEKPTPIKSPTLQVLDYGEAVALFNFSADLPVELSFRKVSKSSYCLKMLSAIRF